MKTRLNALLIAATLAVPAAQATDTLCLQLDSQQLGISPLVFKLQVTDVGDGVFNLSGRSKASTVTNPPKIIQRLVRGNAGIMPDGLEVSLDTSDISDWVSTAEVESLNVSDVHMLLDPQTLSGTFHMVNTAYTTDSPTPAHVTGVTGTVASVSCPF